jgi:hypothetical protein
MDFFGTQPTSPVRLTGSPVKTTTYTDAPSAPFAPSKRYNRDIEAMNELITELYAKESNVHPVSTFQEKLLNNQTELLERENQNPVTRVYIDNATQNDRLVYKISYKSIIQREIEAYEALEKHDVKREHILTRVGDPIMLNEKFGMFITKWKKGLESENLIWPKITQAENDENDENKTEADRLHGLEKEATKYLMKAGVQHKDIAGNLYEVDGTFVWIDFEQSETKKSWFSSISPFPSPEKRPGLFGDENESPNKKVNSNRLFDSSDDDDEEMGGGKSRNKKSRKNKKHKRKSKSNKHKSNKRKTKSHKRK